MITSGRQSFPVAGNTIGGQICEGVYKAKFKPNWGNYKDDAEAVEGLQRTSRSCNAARFGCKYKSVDGIKTFISSDSFHLWSDQCYDQLWVGVQGKESICVVTLNHDVDLTRVSPSYPKPGSNDQALSDYAQAIISEVECIPYDDENRGSFGHGTERPFSVVSVIPFDEGSGHEASSLMHDARKAIDFLTVKMRSNLAFTFEETVKTAIAAFQYLCRRELKAEDIWVSTTWNLEGGSVDMKLPEIKEYFDIINGVSSGEGRQPKVPPPRPGPPAGEPFGKDGLFVTNVAAPVFNFLGAYNHLTFSEERPLSTRGGGCCSSSDEEDESGGLFTYRKKSTVPNTEGSPPPAFM